MQETKDDSIMGGLRESQVKADGDSDVEGVSPAADIPPPPPPEQMDDPPGFADFGDGAPAPTAPSPVLKAPSPAPPTRPPQPDFSDTTGQTPTTATTTATANKEQPKAALKTPPSNVAIPRPKSPRAPSPGIVLAPPVAATKDAPEAPGAPTAATEEAAPTQAPQQKWEGGFEDNFSDLGLSSEVQTPATTDVDAAFKPASPQPPLPPPPPVEPESESQLEPQPELPPPPEPSPSPEPERAKSPCLGTCRTILSPLF